ncbi:hypothetical protein Sjap_014265 [Stephania japonica]|uniref:E3 ubiquitin-protein ligase listerin n=1 Tax=Stephania japonica TaxID=461633 RepID=A0AAP0IZK6_9MAGN
MDLNDVLNYIGSYRAYDVDMLLSTIKVISASLLALATLVDILFGIQSQKPGLENVSLKPKSASKARESSISSAERIFSSHKCLSEFLKSPSPHIRSATYSVMGCFIKHIPHLFDEGSMKILSLTILGAFQEKDPTCHSSMWDAILLFSRRFPDSWGLSDVQKLVLDRFWYFLRNGCYGSQQVSYPILVLFLETLPPKAMSGEIFFLDFFQNLWAGRNSCHSSDSDQLAFFRAFRDCFIYIIQNAPRYFNGREAVYRFHVSLVSNVLVNLLWRGYLLKVSSKIENMALSETSIHLLDESIDKVEKLSIKYPLSYMQNLGICIIEILSDIYAKECDLLGSFCEVFQKNFLEICKLADSVERSVECVDQMVNFWLLLDQYAVRKGETWPLQCLARPVLTEIFPLIRTLDSPYAVKLLSVMVSIFGPRKILLELPVHLSGKSDIGSTSDHLLLIFKEFFVPWCLRQCNHHSINERLDLLLSLLDDELFAEQWSSIITFATRLEEDLEPGSKELDQISVLAMLMEKVRDFVKRKMGNMSNDQKCFLTEKWHHQLLDSTAVSIACSHPPIPYSYSRVLRCGQVLTQPILKWAVLGGLIEDDQFSLISENSVVFIYKELLKKLLSLLVVSSFDWAKAASSFILSTGAEDSVLVHDSLSNTLDAVKFSLSVVEGSFFCLNKFDEYDLVPCILASIFTIDWEYRMASQTHADESIVDVELESKLGKSDLGGSIQMFRDKICSHLRKGVNKSMSMKLEHILIEIIRSIIYEKGAFNTDKVPSLCCEWTLEVLEFMNHDHSEEQVFLDQLWDEGRDWSLFVVPVLRDGTRSAQAKAGNTFTDAQVSDFNLDFLYLDSLDDMHGTSSVGQFPSFRSYLGDWPTKMGWFSLQTPEHEGIDAHWHQQFIAFVSELISKLGFARVIAASSSQSILPLSVEASDGLMRLPSYSRAWLASEVLCTWEWKTGNALRSFLPLLGEFANGGKYYEESLVDSIVNILLDGALVCGAHDEQCFFNVWIASDDEVENIKDPFLRALVSLLLTLYIKGNTWGKDKAAALFKHLADKLYVGTLLNRDCLRILPFVLNAIIQQLRNRENVHCTTGGDSLLDTGKENEMHAIFENWLQRALLLPPFYSWQEGQDMEEWVELIVSCYPLDATGGIGALQSSLGSNISQLEKTLLLDLFRKQRPDGCESTAVPQSLKQQLVLSKLIAISVGYCWKDFNEDDWQYTLSQLRKWIESVVLVMEDLVEKVDEMKSDTYNNVEIFRSKVEQVFQIVDSSLLNVVRNAIFTFSLFCSHVESLKQGDSEVLSFLETEEWTLVKDQIHESVLRIFFATGATEAIADSCCQETSYIVASSRLQHPHFWDLVAHSVIGCPQHVKKVGVQSMELWGLSKGPISSLYAILFSSKPIPSLQFAAYFTLSTEPVSVLSITKENISGSSDVNNTNDLEFGQSNAIVSSSEETIHLREEIADMIERSPSELLEMDLLAQQRVNVFIAWTLLLSNLQALPSTSLQRQRLIQYMQDSANSATLDCLFQHIPLKYGVSQSFKKKDVVIPVEVSQAANAAALAISTGSAWFCIKSLSPVERETMASLAGALYGLMLRVLPAYVRDWFTSLRDRSTSSAIESFTKVWCSPSLLADELSQIKKASITNENFSVSVSKSAYEVVATYKKEETGMDLVISLPASYPLRPVDVDCTKSLGISDLKQRKWLMSMIAFVRSQNGALAEAIRTWKSNFDKEFEGVEECPICYSIIHTANNSLPRLACKTCTSVEAQTQTSTGSPMESGQISPSRWCGKYASSTFDHQPRTT